MKIVQFRNGKYGLRRCSIIGYQFIGRDGEHWWVTKELIPRHCHFNSIEELDAALPDNGKPVPKRKRLTTKGPS